MHHTWPFTPPLEGDLIRLIFLYCVWWRVSLETFLMIHVKHFCNTPKSWSAWGHEVLIKNHCWCSSNTSEKNIPMWHLLAAEEGTLPLQAKGKEIFTHELHLQNHLKILISPNTLSHFGQTSESCESEKQLNPLQKCNINRNRGTDLLWLVCVLHRPSSSPISVVCWNKWEQERNRSASWRDACAGWHRSGRPLPGGWMTNYPTSGEGRKGWVSDLLETPGQKPNKLVFVMWVRKKVPRCISTVRYHGVNPSV